MPVCFVYIRGWYYPASVLQSVLYLSPGPQSDGDLLGVGEEDEQRTNCCMKVSWSREFMGKLLRLAKWWGPTAEPERWQKVSVNDKLKSENPEGKQQLLQMQKKTPVIKLKMNQKPRRTKQEHGEYMRTEEQAREHRRHRRANTEENTGLDKQAMMSTDGHRKMSFSGIFSTLTIDDQVTPLQHSKLKFLQCNFWHLFNFS